MTAFLSQPPREQAPLVTQPYDHWIIDDDFVKAEFHRLQGGYLLRFPGEADFEIHPEQSPKQSSVIGWPAPATSPGHFLSLYHNAVVPLIGDHNGGLFLHGSAVAIAGRAVAFIGQSGDGKTTLAGAFAKTGHPFLTEDVIELVQDGTDYLLCPKPSGLRLYADSAAYLLGRTPDTLGQNDKFDVADAMALPFRDQPAPLAAIFLLGSNHAAPLAITSLRLQAATQQLLPHSFILDVEDKPRLRGHFSRIVGLSSGVRCYTIDYIRDYAELPKVMTSITTELEKAKAGHDQ